ncbi:hypothetical protein GUITHDRAFT_158760 [Guillardia theta CCMP2712]|uniref:JmjC domain-containing protein n=1 Tax=Guillardia theta (strain CCMP2712) TaxID=905079 RepID=L1IGX7_GUITC|nr:hypothetical protein GUITHDRAFT_158760 [Guillardia theta CCMP2712]EKX35179.1 hypothetical protein GUITHDRAFT_158760 [Guillardia theta CCMP2712]|eukprot:XP_005822159.1 hypothetical protein GUITHDRAFT_158760 [Guillardia theta CCMP2712]
MGACVGRWTAEYLHERTTDKVLAAGVHVCPYRTVDLAGHRLPNSKKNFHFCEMTFVDFIRRCNPDKFQHLQPLPPVVEEGERLYLRSVAAGQDAAKRASHIHETFPELAEDLTLPAGIVYPPARYHSSVLRVTGSKVVTLWPPVEDQNLYTQGSSSRVESISNPDLALHPRFFETWQSRLEGELKPGDAVYIPPLWFHHVRMPSFSVAVNVFWCGSSPDLYNPKDLYGNKDLPVLDQALALAARAGASLSKIPQPFRSFYARRLMRALDEYN